MAAEIPLKLPLPEALEVDVGGQRIAGDDGGQGPPIVQLHGLTATRRYVTMGSRLLQRRGYRQIGYDARGHGESGPAPAGSYEYADLVRDLEGVLDHLELDRAILVGSSMGAATALAFALEHPERAALLVQLTPAFEGAAYEEADGLAWWDSLADGLERGGVEGFMEAYAPMIRGRFAESIERLTRQRLERHLDPVELAKAVRAVPGSSAFDGIERLEELQVPTLVIGSRDEADPGHPLRVAEEYARRIPVSELVVEEPGKPPIAWRGAHLSRAIAAFAARHGAGPDQPLA
jgi:pimeloyl-ACP methyl ester carboxylesterase